MHFTTQTTIERPPAEVFDRMADARNETAWNSQVSRSELESDEPVREGSRFTTYNRGKPYTAVITTYDRPNLLVFEVSGGSMDITATFRFRPEREATAMDAAFDMRPKGALRLMSPMLAPAIGRDLPKQSASFKAFCESAAVAPAG